MPNSHFIHDDDASNESLLIHDIARLFKKNFDRRVKYLGLTRAQWLSVGMLRRYPGMSQAELAEKLDVEPITIARIVDRLQKSGWIERRDDANDRRINRLYLTARVQEVVGHMREKGLECRSDATLGLTADEHAQLLATLKKIKHNLCEKNKA